MNIKACVHGDKRAWDTFVEQTYGVIFAAVRGTLAGHAAKPDHAEIEDIIQDVFVRIIKNNFELLRTYDPDRGSITTWLTWIARSTAIDHFRRRRGWQVPLDRLQHASADERRDEAPELPLHLLTGRQRLTLRLLLDEGRTVEQTAEILGVSPQTVYSTKNKAISRLREHLAQEVRDTGNPAGRSPPGRP